MLYIIHNTLLFTLHYILLIITNNNNYRSPKCKQNKSIRNLQRHHRCHLILFFHTPKTKSMQKKIVFNSHLTLD